VVKREIVENHVKREIWGTKPIIKKGSEVERIEV